MEKKCFSMRDPASSVQATCIYLVVKLIKSEDSTQIHLFICKYRFISIHEVSEIILARASDIHHHWVDISLKLKIPFFQHHFNIPDLTYPQLFSKILVEIKNLQKHILQGLAQNPGNSHCQLHLHKKNAILSNACPPWVQVQHLSWQLGTPTPSLKIAQ